MKQKTKHLYSTNQTANRDSAEHEYLPDFMQPLLETLPNSIYEIILKTQSIY